ncbi:MAG TPA: transcriptional regulator [Ghiorsea sp.]|nr:transcriptional regulator [Ghiorsea sp.]HIP06290.1 transcriptional regulator [Mariprofundaceae bacterium]
MVTISNKEPCDGDCPIKKTASIIEGKWTTLVIRELLPGKKRYSELQKALVGISPKVLTTRLRMLEHEKLITRKIYPTVPPKTEYELTTLGKRLEVVLYAMAKFGESLGN